MIGGRPRWDLLNALEALGWERVPGRPTVVTKGDALFASWSSDSGLDGHRDAPSRFTISFTGDVPNDVIVATCQAAVKGARGRIGSRRKSPIVRPLSHRGGDIRTYPKPDSTAPKMTSSNVASGRPE